MKPYPNQNSVGSEIAYHNWTDCHFFSCPRGVILAPLGKIKQALIWYDWKDTCDDIKMSGPDKGQLISEWNFGVFKSSKMWTFFWQISALASKMGQIKKITAQYHAIEWLFITLRCQINEWAQLAVAMFSS